MKIYKKLIISLFIAVVFAVFSSNAQALTLSQTNVSLTVGQTSTITVSSDNYYNNYGTSYLSNNSNPSVATASVNGNIVSIYGVSTGGTTLTICQNYNNASCGYIYVTVNGYGYNNGTNSLSLNISNLTLSIGSSITISPSSTYNYSNYNNTTGLYVSNNSNPSVASASASSSISGCYGNNLYSITTGQLCNSNYNNYNNYSSLYSYTIPGCYGSNLYSITTGQLCNGNGSNNNGSSIVITALTTGTDNITLCQNSGSSCNTINVTVSSYSTPINSYYSLSGDSSVSSSGIPIIYSTSSAN